MAEDDTGQTTHLGVTSEHPLFVTSTGWTPAGDIGPGDTIRNADLAALRVLAVEQDLLPVRVHNLEIARAHTYFAGELEAWGHNGGRPPAAWWQALRCDTKVSSLIRGFLTQQKNAGIPPSRWRLPPGYDQGHFPANRGAHNMCSRVELARDNRGRPGKTGRSSKWR